MKICCIFGTRPEVIKMAPVIHELKKKHPEITTHVVCSGQHRELLNSLIEWFELNVDLNMDVMAPNQNLNALSAKLMSEFDKLFTREKYDCVVAQGDTTTVLMAAIAAFYAKIPYGHVEAGLRTFDRNLPFPEEMNRVLVGKSASLHFAPTQVAADNLRREGVAENEIVTTGNTVIDALYYTVKKLGLDAKNPSREKLILVTAHRRENHGEPLKRICRALARIAKDHSDFSIVFPVHPNPNVRSVVYELLGNLPNISLVEPLAYDELVRLMVKSYLVITDSGGLQEEAPALKKPVLVLREETERPEVVDLGGARLVGSDEDLIVDSVDRLIASEKEYQEMIIGYSPYGTGQSAELTVKSLVQYLKSIQAEASLASRPVCTPVT